MLEMRERQSYWKTNILGWLITHARLSQLRCLHSKVCVDPRITRDNGDVFEQLADCVCFDSMLLIVYWQAVIVVAVVCRLICTEDYIGGTRFFFRIKLVGFSILSSNELCRMTRSWDQSSGLLWTKSGGDCSNVIITSETWKRDGTLQGWKNSAGSYNRALPEIRI